jgi:hypothetical protein
MPKKLADPSKVAPSPSWTLDKGISYSLLTRFINCRERFRLYAVEGMREERSSKESMDWGTYFHELIELHAKHPNLPASGIIRRAKRRLSADAHLQANIVFEAYMQRYADCNYHYVAQEQEFRIPYRLPNGKTIHLVGKTDEIIGWPDNTLWIQENKTKEKINEYKIESGLIDDLQTMMYAVCMEALFKKPIGGVIYNVIRQPSLSPSKVKATKTTKARKETTVEFLARLRADIEERHSHYFKRWEIPFPPGHMEGWKRRSFDPLLMQLYHWWESVKHDPFSPWDLKDGTPNHHHWRKPFGIYDSMTTGTGDFFDFLTRGLTVGVSVGNDPFPELETIK